MEKVVVTGGKGGTGKSTVAVLLAKKALNAGKKVFLVDLDVEGPSLFLFLGEKLENEVKEVFTEKPMFIKEKCRKCGLCGKVCYANAIFAPVGKYPVLVPELCSGCGACWMKCPYGAIVPEKEVVGRIFKSRVKENLTLVTGVSDPGIEETGPIVGEVREFALKEAEKEGVEIAILDSAAGTHCPVARAAMGADRAVCVTEPTPLGAYDLGLILELCEKLGVPAVVFLNRAGVGEKGEVEKITQSFKIEIEKEIPLKKEFVRAASKGELLDFKFNL